MTFLELCQAVVQESGVSGDGPASVTSQSGVYKDVVNWVRRAWMEIQILPPGWRWMVGHFSFSASSGQGNYTATGVGLSNFGRWDEQSVRIYETALGVDDETTLTPITYQRWREWYNTGDQDDARPRHVTVKPDMSLQLAPVPDAALTVSGDYRKAPVRLSANADTPSAPSQFHEVIVHRALMHMFRDQEAWDNYKVAEADYRWWLNALRQHQTIPLDMRVRPFA